MGYDLSKIRNQAEKRLRCQAQAADYEASDFSVEELNRLIHELQVHEIELEMQNEELRRTMVELEASRAKYSALYDFAPVGYFSISSKAVILDVNLTGALMFGVERKKLTGGNFCEFIASSSQDIFYCYRKKIIKTGASQKCELKMIKKDGTEFHVQLESMPDKNPDGEVDRFRSTITDITPLLLKKKALQDSESRFRMLYENAPLGYQSLDENGYFIEVNQAWLDILGYSRDEVIGRSFADFIHPDWRKHFQYNFPRFKAVGEILGVEFEMIKKDGSHVIVSFNGKIGRNERGEFMQTHCILHDITHQKQAEISQKEAYEGLERQVEMRTAELMESNRLLKQEIAEHKITEKALKESEKKLRLLTKKILKSHENEKKRISLGLHDELAQSLAVLKLMLNSIKDGLNEDQVTQKEAVTEISNYANEMIEKVRNLSRDLNPSALDDLGLTAAIRWMIEGHAENFNIVTSYNFSDIDTFFPDERKVIIYRIFQELFDNIKKHAMTNSVKAAIKKEKDHIYFEVKDNGKGFDVNKIYNNNVKGMGLATIEERVKMMGGNLNIFSREEKGTYITFSIPVDNKKNDFLELFT